METLYIIDLFCQLSEKFNYQYKEKIKNSKEWNYNKNIIINKKEKIEVISMSFYFLKMLGLEDIKVFSPKDNYLEFLEIEYEIKENFQIYWHNLILCEEKENIIINIDNLLQALKESNIKLYNDELDISINLEDKFENIKLANILRLNGYKVDKFKPAKFIITESKDDLLIVESNQNKEEIPKDYILMYLNERMSELDEEIYE